MLFQWNRRSQPEATHGQGNNIDSFLTVIGQLSGGLPRTRCGPNQAFKPCGISKNKRLYSYAHGGILMKNYVIAKIFGVDEVRAGLALRQRWRFSSWSSMNLWRQRHGR